VRRSLQQHSAVSGDLEAEKRGGSVERDELDATASGTCKSHFQRAKRGGIDAKHTDVHIARRSRRLARGGAE
jgi:hypothetical protein